jgi:hypothetical protein
MITQNPRKGAVLPGAMVLAALGLVDFWAMKLALDYGFG